jgi:hypothetical protein
MENCEDYKDDYDNSWIHNYEVLEHDYSSFYKESVDSVKLYFMYINHDNEIDTINQEDLIISGKIEKEKVYKIIKEKKYKNKVNYKLIGLLKYNISLDPYHVKYFLEDSLDIDINESFLTPLYKIDDISFEDTITLFKDLNSVYFIFYDNSNSKYKKTDSESQTPEFISQQSIHTSNPTKKVRFNLKPKKTKKR